MTHRSVKLQLLRSADWILAEPMMKAFYKHFGYVYSDRMQGRAFRELLADDRLGSAWFVRVNAQPVGYVVMTLGWSIEYGGRVAVVDELYVLPEFRGHGIGRRVLAQMRAEARRAGIRKLFLEVESFNRRAKALYARTGFGDTRRTLMRMDVRR